MAKQNPIGSTKPDMSCIFLTGLATSAFAAKYPRSAGGYGRLASAARPRPGPPFGLVAHE